jgi:hypothetical protein
MVGIRHYIELGQPVGDFLRAVICNDLKNAVGHADDVNVHNLPAYCAYLHNHAPSDCHGSPEKYKAWIKEFEDIRKQCDLVVLPALEE